MLTLLLAYVGFCISLLTFENNQVPYIHIN